MKIKEARETLFSLLCNQNYSISHIWGTLHNPPELEENKEYECYKPMLRLIVRWLDMYFREPLTPNGVITDEWVRRSLIRFFGNFRIDDNRDVNQAYLTGRQGFVFWGFYLILSWIEHLDFIQKPLQYRPIAPAGSLTLARFKQAVTDFVKPPQPEYRMIWYRHQTAPAFISGEGTISHQYSLLSFYGLLQYASGKFKIDPFNTARRLRAQTLGYLAALPWSDHTPLMTIAELDPGAVPLVALYDVMQSYYCLPKPRFPQPTDPIYDLSRVRTRQTDISRP